MPSWPAPSSSARSSATTSTYGGGAPLPWCDSLCLRQPPLLAPAARSRLAVAANVSIGGDANPSGRYFSVVDCSSDATKPPRTCLFFKNGREESWVAAAASPDGLSFGAPSVVLRSNWSAARMTHNLGVWREAAGGRHGGGYLFVGGQHNKASADERAGVWAVRTGVWFKHAWRGAAAASPEWLLDGHHPGCVEQRRLLVAYMLPGVCEFDGRLSVVRHPTTGRYMMYARANAAAHGARFVMVATSADLVVWSPFQLLQIGGYSTPAQGDVYFWAAAVNPAAPTTLLAVFPIVDRLRGCLALSASSDGVRWSPPAPLLNAVYGEWTAHHPAAGIVARGDEVWLYVHENVPGVVADKVNARILSRFKYLHSRRRGSEGTRWGGAAAVDGGGPRPDLE